MGRGGVRPPGGPGWVMDVRDRLIGRGEAGLLVGHADVSGEVGPLMGIVAVIPEFPSLPQRLLIRP